MKRFEELKCVCLQPSPAIAAIFIMSLKILLLVKTFTAKCAAEIFDVMVNCFRVDHQMSFSAKCFVTNQAPESSFFIMN